MEKKLVLPAAGKNCFGSRELLAGQSRVPDPPAMIKQSLNMAYYRQFRKFLPPAGSSQYFCSILEQL